MNEHEKLSVECSMCGADDHLVAIADRGFLCWQCWNDLEKLALMKARKPWTTTST